MSNPTTPFGWQMPTATDLVTDLPADFEVFGQAVATSMGDLLGGTTGQVLAKASSADMDFVWSADAAGMVNPMTTTGDVIYSSPGSTPVRLAAGSTGNVLTIAGGVPTWAAPAAAADNFVLLNSGGTSLSGSVVTVSGISNQNKILAIVQNATSNFTQGNLYFRVNGITSGYQDNQTVIRQNASYAASNIEGQTLTHSGINVARTSSAGGSIMMGTILIQGAATSGLKVYTGMGGAKANGGNEQFNIYTQGVINTTTITSLSVFCDQNWGGGTLYIYGSA